MPERGHNYRIQRAFFDRVWHDEEEKAIYDLFDGEATGIDPTRALNPDAYVPWYRGFLSVVGDVDIEMFDCMEREDRLFLRFVLRGRARKTGDPISWHGAGWGRYSRGKMIEAVNYLDNLDLFRQLGLVPEQAIEKALAGENLFAEVEELARAADERNEHPDPWLVRCGVAGPSRHILVMPGAGLRPAGGLVTPDEGPVPMGVILPAGSLSPCPPARPLPDPEQLEVLFEGSAFGMVICDTDDRILEANTSFAEMVGRDLERLVGTRFEDLLHPDDRADQRRRLRDLVSGFSSHHRVEVRLLRREAVVFAQVASVRVERPGAPDLVLRSVQDESGGRLEEVVQFQETERRLLSYDLHDGLAQDLASLWIHLQTSQALGTSDAGAEARDELAERTLGLVKRMSADLEKKMRDLRSPVTEGVDLPRALADMVGHFLAEDSLEVVLETGPELASVEGIPALFTYRIVQEALRNAVRHGGAREARVSLSVRDGRVHGEIRDRGRGFDPARATGRRGYGMAGMKERCHLLRGAFEVESQPGRGATVRFALRLR